jgi:hypothetical protein
MEDNITIYLSNGLLKQVQSIKGITINENVLRFVAPANEYRERADYMFPMSSIEYTVITEVSE